MLVRWRMACEEEASDVGSGTSGGAGVSSTEKRCVDVGVNEDKWSTKRLGL